MNTHGRRLQKRLDLLGNLSDCGIVGEASASLLAVNQFTVHRDFEEAGDARGRLRRRMGIRVEKGDKKGGEE